MGVNNSYMSGNGNEYPLQVSYLLIYFTCDVNVTSLSRSRVMTLMSCDSVCCCCMCGQAWSSRWLMTQLTNGQYARVLVFAPVVDVLNIPCDCHFVFFVLEELYVSHHAW